MAKNIFLYVHYIHYTAHYISYWLTTLLCSLYLLHHAVYVALLNIFIVLPCTAQYVLFCLMCLLSLVCIALFYVFIIFVIWNGLCCIVTFILAKFIIFAQRASEASELCNDYVKDFNIISIIEKYILFST